MGDTREPTPEKWDVAITRCDTLHSLTSPSLPSPGSPPSSPNSTSSNHSILDLKSLLFCLSISSLPELVVNDDALTSPTEDEAAFSPPHGSDQQTEAEEAQEANLCEISICN